MHQPAVRIPLPMFHSLPTLNRTFILWISALSDHFDFALFILFGFKTHCIWGKRIALRFCLGNQGHSLGAYGGIVAKAAQPADFGLTPKPG